MLIGVALAQTARDTSPPGCAAEHAGSRSAPPATGRGHPGLNAARSQAVQRVAAPPRLLASGGEFGVGRVADRDERQSAAAHNGDLVGSRRRGRAARPASRHHAGPRPRRCSAPTSERTIEWQNASACTVHTISSPRARDVEGLDRPDRRRALAVAAERDEVVLADQRRGRLRPSPPASSGAPPRQNMPAQQGIHPCLGVADAVLVAAPQRREPRVERRGHLGDPGDAHVRRQHAGEAVQQRRVERLPSRRVEIGVGHLPGGVHAGVGAPGHGQRDRRLPGYPRQRILQHALHGAPAGLDRPAGEVRPVIGDVEANRTSPPNAVRSTGSSGSCTGSGVAVRRRPWRRPVASSCRHRAVLLRRRQREPAASAASAVANQPQGSSGRRTASPARGRASSSRSP